MFPVNQILRMGDVRRRLLWCDVEQVVWIDIDSATALPEVVAVTELEKLLMDGAVERIDDPFLDTTLRDVEEGSVEQQKRDAAWAMLADVAEDTGLLERRSRGDRQERNAASRRHQTDGISVVAALLAKGNVQECVVAGLR